MYILIFHIMYMNESCHTEKKISVMCEMWGQKWHTHNTRMYQSRGAHILETWLIYIYYLNHLNVWSDLFICVMPQVVSWGDCEMTWDGENIFYTWHDSSIYVMWLIHICDVTYLCVSCHSHLMRWLWDDVRWREHIVYMAYEAYDTAHARELKTTLYLICK